LDSKNINPFDNFQDSFNGGSAYDEDSVYRHNIIVNRMLVSIFRDGVELAIPMLERYLNTIILWRKMNDPDEEIIKNTLRFIKIHMSQI
jgi:hypothetical protein